MRSTSLSTKLIMVFVSLAVIAYFAAQGYQYLVSDETTVPIYAYRAEDTVMLNGFVVRDETVVDCSEALVELTRAEGERVAANKPIATVYQSRSALEASEQLDVLALQLDQLKSAQAAANDTEAALRLDADIALDLVSVRALVASGDYTALDTQVPALKTTVLKREYAYRGSADLDTRIADLEAQIQTVSASVGGGSQTVRAPFAGTYSAVVDGYETVLTPEWLESVTPSALDRVEPEQVHTTVGKLIEGNRWYYVAAVDEQTARLLSPGENYALRASSGVEFDLPMTVQSVSRAEKGRAAVVLSSDEYLSYVTLLRGQSAELILHDYEGLRVPTNALRVKEDGRMGVYCRVGLRAYFKPVEVVYRGEDYFLVRPGKVEAPSEGQVVLYTIRADDEAIISSNELYDGKVVD